MATRTELRRRVGRLLGDFQQLMATAAGATDTFVDEANLAVQNGALVGRQIYFASAASAANAGRSARVAGNAKTTCTLTFAPALPAATAIGDVAELWNERGTGVLVEDVHAAINACIADVADACLTPVATDAADFDWAAPTIDIPETWDFICDVEWKDYEDRWRPVPPADWRARKADRTVELTGRARELAYGRAVRLLGAIEAAELAADDDATAVDAGWIARQATADLLLASAHRRVDGMDAARLAQYHQNLADQRRNTVRTRPAGKFIRLPA